jgi:hypothetical protein
MIIKQLSNPLYDPSCRPTAHPESQSDVAYTPASNADPAAVQALCCPERSGTTTTSSRPTPADMEAVLACGTSCRYRGTTGGTDRLGVPPQKPKRLGGSGTTGGAKQGEEAGRQTQSVVNPSLVVDVVAPQPDVYQPDHGAQRAHDAVAPSAYGHRARPAAAAAAVWRIAVVLNDLCRSGRLIPRAGAGAAARRRRSRLRSDLGRRRRRRRLPSDLDSRRGSERICSGRR